MGFVLRAGGLALAASSAGLALVASVSASCATADEQAGPVDEAGSSVVPEAGAPDASALDGGCDGDAACVPTKADCTGASWCPVEAPLDARYALRAVWGSAANDVWAVGSAGTVLHFDGATWVSTPADTTRTLSAVGGSSKSDVWIAGSTSAVFHSAGFVSGKATWTDVSPQPYATNQTEAILAGLWSRSAGDVWISGKCFRVTGQPATATRWRGRVIEPGDAGDVGGGIAWTTSGSCPTTKDSISALWGSGATLWAAGTAANVFRTTDPVPDGGGAPVWTELDSQSLQALTGIWGSADDDVWIVGLGGTIRHFTGDSLLEFVESPTTHALNAVWGTSKSDVWAVGELGTILHFDGTQWLPSKAAFDYGAPDLYGVWGSGPDDVWAVGEGAIVRLVKPTSKQQGDGQ